MKSANRELLDRLAAEYVLGTLRHRARRRFERWLLSPQVGAIVKAWEDRLAGLEPQLAPVTPPATVWHGIEDKLELRKLRRRPAARWLAIAASLAFFVMAGILLTYRQPPDVPQLARTQESLLQATGGKVPDDKEVVQGQGETPGQPVYYLVKKEAVITGRDLKNARAGVDQNNAPDVQFTLNPQGADKFKRETGRNVGKRLAIILDGSVASAPTIQSQIGSEGVITGRFTTQEADELSKVLRAGALPASLKYQQELTVGASLGKDSIRSGIIASAAGVLFLTVFMLVYYRMSGLNAVVALAANVLILLGAMAYTGATLTLPGIAGIILTIGVGVDTNVLVFERIREELRNGRAVRAAITNGFERVWITILDTHATALIAAAFLFQFGTGPIKGFAVTLVIGLIANIFASYFVSRFLFEWVLGKRQVQTLSI